MINLDLIPNVNTIDAQEKNANGGMIAQLIVFYIGVAAFVLVCCIPPFTLFLPYTIPIIALIVIFVNLAYFGKFLERANKKLASLVDNTKNMYNNTASTLTSETENTENDTENDTETRYISLVR